MSDNNDWNFHNTPQYRLGCAQLARWHEVCREKRLGMAEVRRKLDEKSGRVSMAFLHESPYRKIKDHIARIRCQKWYNDGTRKQNRRKGAE